MDVEKYNVLAMDFQSLMSCIDCHTDLTNIPVILETLKTIVDICTNEDCGKDAFREEGGLDFLMELLSTTESTILLEHLLKTLALVIDENVHSQMHLTKREYFVILQAIIQKPAFPPAIIKNSLLLLSSLLFQNGLAQGLLAETGFLLDIINLFEKTASFNLCINFCETILNDSPIDILISAVSALCFAVNNPQNERNQETCSVLFSLLLKLFESCNNSALCGSITSFLSLSVANNVKNQQKFVDVDGLLLVKRSLQKSYHLAKLDVQEFHGEVAKCTVQSISNMIGVTSAVASENEKISELIGKFGILTIMIKLLTAGILEDSLQTRMMLTLACCIDAKNSCKSYVLGVENFHSFLKSCFQKSDPELLAASKYLLQVCLNGNDNFVENDVLKNDREYAVGSDKFNNRPLFEVHNLSETKSASDISVRSAINSKRHRPSRSRNDLSDTLCRNEHFQESDKQSAIFSDKLNKFCSHDSKNNLKSVDSGGQSFKPFAFYSSSSLKNVDVGDCIKIHKRPTPSVKSYQNSKKENVVLINSKMHSVKQLGGNNTYCNEALSKQSSMSSLEESKNSTAFNNKSFSSQIVPPILPSYYESHSTTHSKQQLNNSHSFRDSFETFKKPKSVLIEKDNVCDKLNLNFNESFKSPTTYRAKHKSKKRCRPAKENSAGNLDFLRCHTNDFSFELPDFTETSSILSAKSFSNSKGFPSHATKLKDIGNLTTNRYSFTNVLDDSLPCKSSSFRKPCDSKLSPKTVVLEKQCDCSYHQSRKSSKKKKFIRSSNKSVLSSTSNNLTSNQDSNFGNNMQVITLPADCCEQHKLITSSELLKVKKLKELVLSGD